MAWPVEFWKSVFDWGSVILVSLTVLTGAGALITGKIIGDRQDEKIAELNTRSSEAQKEAAEAKERTAGLEKQTAELTAQNLRLEGAISPRRLIPKQLASLSALKFSGRLVAVKSYSADSEGLVLATQIKEALEKSGSVHIQDNRSTMHSAGTVMFGVLVDGPDKPIVDAIKAALGNELTKTSVISSTEKYGVMGESSFGVVTLGRPVSATITVGLKPIK